MHFTCIYVSIIDSKSLLPKDFISSLFPFYAYYLYYIQSLTIIAIISFYVCVAHYF